MNTLTRYIGATFIRLLLVILAAMLSLYGLIEFIEKVDDFLEHGAHFVHYLRYPLYNLPLMLSFTLPLAMLLAAFATIASLSRTNQLTAMLGGGVNFMQVCKPLFLCGLFVSVLTLLSNLWLVPWGIGEAEYLLESEIKGTYKVQSRQTDLMFRSGNELFSIAQSFPQKGELDGLTVIDVNKEFMPVDRLEAAHAYYIGDGQWRFEDVIQWTFSPETQEVVSYERHAEVIQDLQRTPDDMLQLWYDPEQMDSFKLREFITKLQSEGYDAREYLVEEQVRIARAATPLIMVLLGVPFARQRGREVSFSFGITVSLGVFLVYFLLYATFAAIGSAAILPPLVAAWSANVLMALFGGWLFLSVKD